MEKITQLEIKKLRKKITRLFRVHLSSNFLSFCHQLNLIEVSKIIKVIKLYEN